MSTTATARTLPHAIEALLGPPDAPPAPLGGTERHLRARFGGRELVVRLAGDEPLLPGDAAAEREAIAAAAAAGIAPVLAAHLDEPPTLVTELLPGRVLSRGDLGQPDMIAEIAVTLWEVHGIRPLRRRFSPWEAIGADARLAAARGVGGVGRFGDLLAGARRIQAAVDPAHPEHAPVPCHNDLLPEKLIHDGEALRIVGWEHAGMGNRYFDLADVAAHGALNDAGEEWLLECYWGEPCTRRRLATLRLMRVMSELRDGVRAIARGDASGTPLDRARSALADPRLGVWVEDARRG